MFYLMRAAMIFRKILVEAEEELKILEVKLTSLALFSNYFSFIKKCAKAILRLRSFIHFRKQTENPKGQDLQLKFQDLTLILRDSNCK